TLAKGNYILTFGDDDILVQGIIEKILNILKLYPDFGILYLQWCLNTEKHISISPNIELLRFDDYEEFLKMITHNITFISGNIVNSRSVKKVNFEKYYNLNLV